MPTLREYREAVANMLGGYVRNTVSLDPDPLDTLAQRSILSAYLFDADKGSKGMAGQFAWVGKNRDQRRIRENGYRSLAYAVYQPPTSGSYTLTFYGYGTTDPPFDWDADAGTIAVEVNGLDPALGRVTVTANGPVFVLSLPDIIDVEISNGTMISQGAVGAVEVNRGFTSALRRGDEFEIHAKLPVLDYDNVQGLNTLINSALQEMWFIDKFPITPYRNARGVRTFYGLTDYNWLVSHTQIIALYSPTLWTNTATFTPPASGSYTVLYEVAGSTKVSSSIAYTATGEQIQTALNSSGFTGVTVTPTGVSSTYTFTVAETWFATPSFSVSSGTIVNNIEMLDTPARYPNVWKFQYDGENPYIDNYMGPEGYSFLIEAYRQANTWICPQTSYGTPGTIWVPSTTGLVDDYDMAIPSVKDVANVTYNLACKQLMLVGPGNETDYWAREQAKAARAAAATKIFDLPMNTNPRGGIYNSAATIGSKGFWGRY